MLTDYLVSILEEQGDFTSKGICVDCKKDVYVNISRTENGGLHIDGGAIYQPDFSLGHEDEYVYKCDECFIKDNKIYQRTEVFTRVVGYLRPVKQFNPGKVAEFDIRKNFQLPA